MKKVTTFINAITNLGDIFATLNEFFYKRVAFFFERRLELAHQASHPAFGKTKQESHAAT